MSRTTLDCATCDEDVVLPAGGDDPEVEAQLADDAGWAQTVKGWTCPVCLGELHPGVHSLEGVLPGE